MRTHLRRPLWLLLAGLVIPVGPVRADQARPPQAPPRDGRPATDTVPAGTASISGTVGVAGGGQPARRARVNLNAVGAGVSRGATTDDLGRFTFTGLLAGKYTLNASKPGHIGVSYGQTRPGRPGTPIQLADGQRFEARLQLYKGGVLTGTILDENGEAIPGTPVRALRYVTQTGQRTLQQSGNGSTDDRGIYRIFGLQPGEYLVGATPRNNAGPSDLERVQAELQALSRQLAQVPQGDETQARDLAVRANMLKSQIPAQEEQTTGYAPVYYPGTTTPGQAGMVTLAAGEEHAGVDFQLQRVPVARIEGLLVNPTGQPLQNMQIVLVSTGTAVPGIDTNSARPDADGHFRISNVVPGQYTLSARGMLNAPGPPPPPPASVSGRQTTVPVRPDPMRLWAMADVVVDGRNVSGVVLTLQPGMTVSGRVAFDGTTQQAPADLSRVRVNLSPETSGLPGELATPANGRVDASGRFTITGVVPGKYRLTGSAPGNGWLLESAMIDSQDALDFSMEVKPAQNVAGVVVTFTDRQSELSGAVVNERGQPAPDHTIVVYAADERYWTAQSRRIRTTRPATDGRFTFANLPPGDYRVAPILDAEPGAWYDPAFLRQLDAAAVRVTLGDGEKKTQNFQVSTR